jgi:hypothetical protein
MVRVVNATENDTIIVIVLGKPQVPTMGFVHSVTVFQSLSLNSVQGKGVFE